MRIPRISGTAFISIAALIIALSLCPVISAQTQSQSQACAAAQAQAGKAQSAQQSVSQAAQNAKDSLKSLGSVFSKKKAPAAATPPPCPPTAAPASGAPADATPQPANSPSQPAPAAQPAASVGQPAPAAPPASAAGQPATATAAPFEPDAGAATGPAATAGSAAAFASNAPPDFSKLPDIGGTVRLGMGHEEMEDGMLKMHPGFKVVPGIPFGTFLPLNRDNKTPPFVGVQATFGPADGKHEDRMFAYYTMPPAKQQAYAVLRNYDYPLPGIDRLKLIAALREKYGHETKSVYYDPAHPGDDTINVMYWVFDEQGHLIASDKGASQSMTPPFNCESAYGPNNFMDMVNQYTHNSLAPANYCDTLVMVSVTLLADLSGSGRPLIQATNTSIMDHALMRRDAQIVGEAAKANSQKQQQQQIDQSKQAKPTL